MGESSSRKRRREEEAEAEAAAAKRRQKKQKTLLSAETITDSPTNPPHRVNGHSLPSETTITDDVKSMKKKKKKEKAAALVDAESVKSHEAADTEEKPKKKKKKKERLQSDIGPELAPEDMMNGVNGTAVSNDPDVLPDAAATETPKKSKKKRSKKEDPELADIPAATTNNDIADAEPLKKTKKSKKRHVEAPQTAEEEQGYHALNGEVPEGDSSQHKKKKKSKKLEGTANGAVEEAEVAESQPQLADGEKRRKKKKKREQETAENDEAVTQSQVATEPSSANPDAMVLDSSPPPRPRTQSARKPAPSLEAPTITEGERSPIVVQTQCLWISLWPQGWDEPLEWVKNNYLKPKLYRFDETLKGVLLSYNNVCLNDRPTREGGATDDAAAVNLVSVNEYSVGYCWLIVELELFVPKRGVHLLGDMTFQNEGHIGVICWGKFNASIDAKRVPKKWTFDPDAEPRPLGIAGSEHQSLVPGSWIDGNGNKVAGRIRFRIVNFDVGLNGDHAFLCIEGTLLSEKSEARLRQSELRELQSRSRDRSQYLLRTGRQLPEHGFTDLGVDETAAARRGWDKSPRRMQSRSRDHSRAPASDRVVEQEVAQDVEMGLDALPKTGQDAPQDMVE